MTRPLRRGAGPVILAILISACGGAATTAGESEPASGTPTGAPSPSPTADLKASFTQWLASADALAADFEGTTQIGDEPVHQLSGTYLAVGDDWDMQMRSSGPDGRQDSGQRFEDEAFYVRSPEADGKWWLVPNATLIGSLHTVLSQASWTAEPSGTSTVLTSGDLNLVALAAGLGLLTEQMNPEQTDEVTGDVSVSVDEDGKPLELELSVEHVQTIVGAAVTRTYALVYTFVEPESGVRINTPNDAWQTHVSTVNGYVWDLPVQWELTRGTQDEPLDSYRAGKDLLFAVRIAAAPGMTPQGTLDDFVEWVMTNEDLEIGSVRNTSVGDYPARYMVGAISDDWFFQEISILVGENLYRIQWASPPGHEKADGKRFVALTAGFAPLAQ